jgi:hypothetical protein
MMTCNLVGRDQRFVNICCLQLLDGGVIFEGLVSVTVKRNVFRNKKPYSLLDRYEGFEVTSYSFFSSSTLKMELVRFYESNVPIHLNYSVTSQKVNILNHLQRASNITYLSR